MTHIVKLSNVRLAFPNLFAPRAAKPGDKAKYGATFIVPQNHPCVAELRKLFPVIAKEKWGDKAGAILTGLEKQDRLCLHDGDIKVQYQGFEGNLYITANGDVRPSVFDRNKTPLQAGDGKPYSGCYVNASIELWPQDHKEHGKRINASLRGVQFHADGDAFAVGTAASEDEFEDLGDQGETDPTA